MRKLLFIGSVLTLVCLAIDFVLRAIGYAANPTGR